MGAIDYKYYGYNSKDVELKKHKALVWERFQRIKEIRINKNKNNVKLESYNKLQFVIWDGTFPVYSHLTDKYYFDFEDILFDVDEYNEDNETNKTSKDMLFVKCVPNNYPEIDYDSMIDDLVPEDFEDIPTELRTKIDDLNNYIKTLPVLSWDFSRKLRTEIDVE